MAIKVNGQTVINDSRQLTNIAGVDDTTVAALTAAGVGGGSHTATASGSIASGKTVMVNSDGTVSQVTGSNLTFSTPTTVPVGSYYPSGATQAMAYDDDDKILVSWNPRTSSSGSNSIQIAAITPNADGSATVHTSTELFGGSTGGIQLTYDPNSDKFLATWAEYAGSGANYYLYARVITVASDGSISMGNRQTIETADHGRKIATIYDPDTSQHIVMSVQGLRALTVSGSTVTYGSRTNHPSSLVPSDVFNVTVGYDTTANKLIAIVMTTYDMNFAVVTVSGTSFTYGTPQQFGTGYMGGAGFTELRITHDPVKNINLFYEFESGGSARAIVFTLSGTTLTQVFSKTVGASGYGGAIAGYNSLVYHPPSGDFIVSVKEYIVQYTVDLVNNDIIEVQKESHTTIFNHTIATQTSVQMVYDSSSGDMWAYGNFRNTSSTDHDPLILRYTPVSTNMFNGVYVGISEGTYADGGTASVLVTGGISDQQTGLTAGKEYYVQLDGSLGQVPADSLSVYAGSTLSSTEIVIKG